MKLINKILFISLIICSSACKNDDEGVPPEKRQLVDYFVYQGNSYTVSYNEDYLIESIRILDAIYTFTYENEKISRISHVQNAQEDTYQFYYNGDGVLNSFDKNDYNYEVDYNPNTLTYSYSNGLLNGSSFYFTVNELGDLKDFRREPVNGNDESWGYEFDTQKKGALYNTNSISLYLYIIQINSLDIAMPFSKYPVRNIYNNNTNYECSNQYDEEQFITKTEVLFNEVDYVYKIVEVY